METFSFDVGAIRCTAVNDGEARYDARDYVINAPEAAVDKAVRGHGLDPTEIPSPYSGLVIDSGTRRVLVDTGAGDLTPSVGRLRRNLIAAEIAPESIDTVVITHGHPDHLGGNVDDAGRIAFSAARWVLGRREWEFWTDETELARLPNVMGEWSRRNLGPLRDRVELVETEFEVAPGVSVIASPGHTPGHVAVAVRSEGAELLYVSDAALHPIHLEHPDWRPVWDLDADAAMTTKRRLFDGAAADGSLVLAFHFPPFPSLGHVEKRGSGWRWNPVEPG